MKENEISGIMTNCSTANTSFSNLRGRAGVLSGNFTNCEFKMLCKMSDAEIRLFIAESLEHDKIRKLRRNAY